MPTDYERREVARRLREIRPCKSGHVEWWGIAQALGLKEPAGWFGWEKFEPESVQRLADLIEPQTSEQTNHDESSLSASPIDRDALLELADEMDRAYPDSRDVAVEYIDDYARRIREACGVQYGQQ